MKRSTESEFIYQLFALLLSVIVVHTIYVALIRPNADAVIQAQLQKEAAGEEYVTDRSFYVVLRDYEQESCFMLMLWSLAIMAHKGRRALREQRMLDQPLLNITPGRSILPDDARDYSRALDTLNPDERRLLLPRVLSVALSRFSTTGSVGDTSTAIKDLCEAEAERLDSELSMVRYIAWAIPAIGFIGTVRGIGEALAQAHRAVEGDIVGVTVSLGVAFNSTLIALLISIVVMFCSHQLQLMQERQVLDTQSYCEDNLMRFLKIR